MIDGALCFGVSVVHPAKSGTEGEVAESPIVDCAPPKRSALGNVGARLAAPNVPLAAGRVGQALPLQVNSPAPVRRVRDFHAPFFKRLKTTKRGALGNVGTSRFWRDCAQCPAIGGTGKASPTPTGQFIPAGKTVFSVPSGLASPRAVAKALARRRLAETCDLTVIPGSVKVIDALLLSVCRVGGFHPPFFNRLKTTMVGAEHPPYI